MLNMNKVRPKQHLVRYSPQLLRKLTTQQWQRPLGKNTGINIYNCITKDVVPVVLINDNLATWYTCGPTVYDASHLGHASCYVKLDIVQRILRQHFGINLVTAMNITDIDDKIIAKSRETGHDWREIAKKHEIEFWQDLRKLNIIEPNMKIRVTDNISKIIVFIEKILKKGKAYVGKDNSVYFDVKAFPYYGKLQKIKLEEENSALALRNKESAADFALWKSRKTPDEPSWESPWGPGRPGWHIECSVLASMIFGNRLDFHAGGVDLKFPHHENEEAQSCVYHDTDQWVNYWVHTGHLNVKGHTEKMSKSLKNTISIDQLLSQYSADAFRMACVLSNYRSSVEYSHELMENANNTLRKFKSFRADCRAYLNGQKPGSDFDSSEIFQDINKASANIDACFRQDFDTARSICVLSELINNTSRCINSNTAVSIDRLISSTPLDVIAAVDNFVDKTLQNFGFSFVENSRLTESSINSEVDLNALIDDILKSRRVIRDKAFALKNKDLFQICDDLRNCLKEHGIEIRDHNQGSSWNYEAKKK